MPSIKETAVETATQVYGKVEPYVPQLAKSVATYGASKVSETVDYTAKTVTGTVDYASKTVVATANYAQAAHNYATERAVAAQSFAAQKAVAAQAYAVAKAIDALEYSKVVYNGATTTLEAYTPSPVKNLVNSSIQTANILYSDPVGTVKPHIPEFIIKIGEYSYEFVSNVHQSNVKAFNATSGYIVTKYKGTTQYVTALPVVAAIIEKLNAFTAPLLEKVGSRNGVEVQIVETKEQ
ncbi:hypothetical protein HDV01_000735 [Terramyces sp. JEL0728]|nr:hypothetical protein HDV01_000735 [Terramyces sp. JEL0728]